MKKLITCLVAVSSLFAATAFAGEDIKLASFEDVSTDLFYKDGWYDGELFVTDPCVAANTVTDGLNKTANAYVAINKAAVAWWGNFSMFGTATPLTITEEHKYMKMMVWRESQAEAFRIAINGKEEVNQLYQGKLKADGVWEDVVMDLTKFIGTDITTIEIINLCAWTGHGEGPAGVTKYMYDEIVLSSDPLPRGAVLKESTDFRFSFEDVDRLNKYVASYSAQAENQEVPNSIEIVDNPFTGSEINATGKVMKFNKCDQGTWWKGGPQFMLTGLYPVTNGNPEFLHILVKTPEFEADYMTIQVSVRDHMGKELNHELTVFASDDWVDLVVPVGSELQYITEFTVRFDVQKDENDAWKPSPAGVYYLDAVELSNSGDERTTVTPDYNAINQVAAEKVISVIALDKAIEVKADQDVTVQLFSANGQLLSKEAVKAGVSSTMNVNQAGIYFVVATGTNGTQTVKVAVK